MSDWINVKDKLPEPHEDVLVYYCRDWDHDKPFLITMAYMDIADYFISSVGHIRPTHWQPLPPPPTEEKSNTVKEILDHLNYAKRKMSGNQSLTGFRETTTVKRMINARLKEKFTMDNFKLVIDHKCDSWKGSKMAEYIRPSTLFTALHFSEYLCEAEAGQKPATEPFEKGEKIHSAEDVYNRMAEEAKR